MPTPTSMCTPAEPPTTGRIADVPVAALATADRLTERHAALRVREVEHREGAWIVARPDDVAAALASPGLAVPAVPCSSTPDDASRLQRRMARFSDGATHAARRAVLDDLMPPTTGLEAAAGRLTTTLVAGRTAPFDGMSLARAVPVTVLASAIGLPSSAAERAAALIGALGAALAPSLDPVPTRPDGAGAARELMELLATARSWDTEQEAAVAGLLFQARDATAALIGTSLLACGAASAGGGVPMPRPDGDRPTVDDVVDRVLRSDAPVQCTRRVAVDDVRLGGVTLPRGAQVWVLLAAAERGAPAVPATFGAGPHACPGRSQAVVLARGVLCALREHGWRPVPDQPIHHEPRPNLRTPASVMIERA